MTWENRFEEQEDFYNQMSIDEILMRENEPIEINWVSQICNNEHWLNVLVPNKHKNAIQE